MNLMSRAATTSDSFNAVAEPRRRDRYSQTRSDRNDRFPCSAWRAWCLALIHHHRNLAAKMFFIEAECLFAIPAEVQLRIKVHGYLV